MMIVVMIIMMIMKLLISVSLDGQFVELWEGWEPCFVLFCFVLLKIDQF